jgi:hypothetical protein
MVIMLLDINSILMNRKHPGGFWVLVLVLLSALAAFFAFGVFRMLALVSRLKKGQAQTASGKAKRR